MGIPPPRRRNPPGRGGPVDAVGIRLEALLRGGPPIVFPSKPLFFVEPGNFSSSAPAVLSGEMPSLLLLLLAVPPPAPEPPSASGLGAFCAWNAWNAEFARGFGTCGW